MYIFMKQAIDLI